MLLLLLLRLNLVVELGGEEEEEEEEEEGFDLVLKSDDKATKEGDGKSFPEVVIVLLVLVLVLVRRTEQSIKTAALHRRMLKFLQQKLVGIFRQRQQQQCNRFALVAGCEKEDKMKKTVRKGQGSCPFMRACLYHKN